MALVPRGEARRLDGIELAESAFYDHLYALKRTLVRHERSKAWREYEALRSLDPDLALTHRARWTLGIYDADAPAILECVSRLLEKFPGNQALELRRLACLRDPKRREERLRVLRGLCSRRGAAPIFRQQLADELRSDARQWETADRLLRSVLRRHPPDAGACRTMAALRWNQQPRPAWRLPTSPCTRSTSCSRGSANAPPTSSTCCVSE